MRKIKFIKKLIEEEIISLIDSSKDIYESYNQKSKNSLKAAKILIDENLLEEATSMNYYTMFHKTNALLQLIGIKCENHGATIILLKEIFGINNKDISDAKEERVDKQYYSDFVITKEEVKNLIEKSEKFIDEIDFFAERLTESERQKYKDTFKETYNLI